MPGFPLAKEMTSASDLWGESARTTSTFGPLEIIDTATKSFSMLYGTLESSGLIATGPLLPMTKL